MVDSTSLFYCGNSNLICISFAISSYLLYNLLHHGYYTPYHHVGFTVFMACWKLKTFSYFSYEIQSFCFFEYELPGSNYVQSIILTLLLMSGSGLNSIKSWDYYSNNSCDSFLDLTWRIF